MPLVGLVNGKRVASTDLSADEFDALKADVRAKRRVLTLPCGLPGHGKVSKLGTQYFVHNPGGDGCSARETPEHLLAKSIIVKAARAAGYDAEPEVRGHTDVDGVAEEWIADVMVTNRHGHRIVFEVQWSRQDEQAYRARTARYAAADISRTAWFARRADHLPPAGKEIPIFDLRIEGTDAEVAIGGKVMPLADAVHGLLTGRIQHRTHLADTGPSRTELIVVGDDCYRCKREFAVWDVQQTIVTGRCGVEARSAFRPSLFAPDRPESDPVVRAAAAAQADAMGLRLARLDTRTSKTSGGAYLGFVCPWCNQLSGDFFIDQLVRDARIYGDPKIITVTTATTAVKHPHWCVGGAAGPCENPTPAILAKLERERQLVDGPPSVDVPQPDRAPMSPETARRIARRMMRGSMFPRY
ncbi:hypothetical protein V6N00_13165 [Tersicoccus sp. MR15.9]|uniref:hypothetical protein n=1 Tax=Tersicoccus mangrovi TaxID=3121635 RepID=UPI002FE56EC1